MPHIPSKKLSDGSQMPIVGLGTYKENDEKKLETAIRAAIDAGYRHFDCAYIYKNENVIGKAIRDAIKESNGALKREDFFIVSKLYNTFHSRDKAIKSLDECLARFGLDYLDLYLMHWPMGFKEDAGDDPRDANEKIIPVEGVHFTETYKVMEELVDSGKTKSIGVSNFNNEQLGEILGMCRIKPVCNQFEVHPLLQADEWVQFNHKHGVQVVAYAPLGAPDRFWGKPEDPVLLETPELVELARKKGKTTAQVVIRWLVQRDIVVIPKSVTPARIQQNADVFDFELTGDEMKVFDMFKSHNFRIYALEFCDNHPDYPFKGDKKN